MKRLRYLNPFRIRAAAREIRRVIDAGGRTAVGPPSSITRRISRAAARIRNGLR